MTTGSQPRRPPLKAVVVVVSMCAAGVLAAASETAVYLSDPVVEAVGSDGAWRTPPEDLAFAETGTVSDGGFALDVEPEASDVADATPGSTDPGPTTAPEPQATGRPSPTPSATFAEPPTPSASVASQPTATTIASPAAAPTTAPTTVPTPTSVPVPTRPATPAPAGSSYQENLLKIRAQPWRNTNEDDSPYRNWTMQQLDADIANQLDNSRTAYIDGGFQEEWHSTETWSHNNPSIAAMRTGCEFSHFAYDDPIVYPNQPERSHLHMFFGNTDANAFTTHNTLWNSGGGTCNGNELNRTGYWVPAMFDQNANVRIPDFINVYYKNDSLATQISKGFFTPAEPYPVSSSDTWIDPTFEGARLDNFNGVQIVGKDIQQDQRQRGHSLFKCINEYGGGLSQTGSLATLQCPTGLPHKSYLEMHVYFQSCWNGQDPSAWNTTNVGLAAGGFYWRDCAAAGYDHIFSGIQYRIRYTVEPGDDTRQWWLASDVDRNTLERTKTSNESSHGDWWGAWNPTVNQMWIDTCGNVVNTACGYGYMDGQPYDLSPNGPTLRYREKFNTSGNTLNKIPAQAVFDVLCSHGRTLARTEEAAWCTPP